MKKITTNSMLSFQRRAATLGKIEVSPMLMETAVMASRFKLLPGIFIALCVVLLICGAPTSAQVSAPFRVYLTFEDGPTDAYTPGILDMLAQYNAKASFLIAGYQIEGREALLQREIREGHALVNHLWSEPGYYFDAPEDEIRESYLRTENALREALGPELPRYEAQVKMFWQPGGGTQPLPPIEGVQVITYNWNVDADDCGWHLEGVDLDSAAFDEAVIDNVLNKPQSSGYLYNAYDFGDGVVIAMHDINRVTGRILPRVLSELQQAGATFEALPRPWDVVDTMAVTIGVPPNGGAGIAGLNLNAQALDYVNLRALPSVQSSDLATIPVNTTVSAIGRADGWIQVAYEGQSGWVYRDLVKVFGPIPSLPYTAP